MVPLLQLADTVRTYNSSFTRSLCNTVTAYNGPAVAHLAGDPFVIPATGLSHNKPHLSIATTILLFIIIFVLPTTQNM